jgi:hypothetical protein
MWFNIAMNNHGPSEYYAALTPAINYTRAALSKCGHEVTVGYDQLYPDAINLYFEHFLGEPVAEMILGAKRAHSLRLGVIATELMVGGTIPYARDGIFLPANVAKDDNIARRMEGFRSMAAGADFVWSFLERTALDYSSVARRCEFFPVGHVSAVPPELRRSPKDVDVVFFGARTPHRAAVLDSLAALGIGVTAVGRGFQGEWMDQSLLLSLLDRARIGLNLTLQSWDGQSGGIDPRFVSCMRVTEMLDRDLCVVSEDIPQDNPYGPYMISAPPERIAATCRDILAAGNWAELGRTRAAAFRRDMDVATLCPPIIERSIP